MWQSGSAKTREKAHLDVTHYEALTDEQVEKIEKIANEIAAKKMKVNKKVLPRTEAERIYGMRIYQGGVVPEKYLRIIEITDGKTTIDAEACGGTHCSSTEEVGRILVTSTERIQDGVVRITIVAGRRAEQYIEEKRRLLSEVENILGVKGPEVIESAKELFEKWKNLRKEEIKSSEKSAELLIKELENKFVKGMLIEKIPGDAKNLHAISKKLSNDNRVLILFGVNERIDVFASAGKNTEINAGKLVSELCKNLGGKGGGSPYLAQGFGAKKEILDDAIEKLKRDLHG